MSSCGLITPQVGAFAHSMQVLTFLHEHELTIAPIFDHTYSVPGDAQQYHAQQYHAHLLDSGHSVYAITVIKIISLSVHEP